MEPEISRPEGDHTGREAARAIVRWAFVATMCSAGLAALLFILLVMPFSSRAWQRAGPGLPAFAQKLLEYRVLLAVGILGTLGLGLAALFGMRRGVLRTALIAVVLMALIAAVASGIIGWWLMFRELYEQAGAEI